MTLNCFVIAPSPEEKIILVPDNRRGLAELPSSVARPDNAVDINFDVVYEQIIKKAIRNVKIEGQVVPIEIERGVEINEPGEIVPKLIERTCLADIIIVDITTANPNVFLEYGIRAVARNQLNIIICYQGTELPFNIKDQQVIRYGLDVVAGDKAVRTITAMVEYFLRPNKEDAQPAAVEDQFKRYFDIHTGRNNDTRLLRAYEDAPEILARLATFLLTQQLDPTLKPQLFKFLNGIGDALRNDPRGSGRAIAFLETISEIKGLSSDKLSAIYYELWLCCNADDNLKQRAEFWIQKMKKLEGEPNE